jgi:hypothetical protein
MQLGTRGARLALGWFLLVGAIVPAIGLAARGDLDVWSAMIRGGMAVFGLWLVLGARGASAE